MNNSTKQDLNNFRKETRAWLEANCPESMRQPMESADEHYWGGRNATFASDDQKIWFERMLEKKWIVPYWEEKYGGGGLNDMENKVLTEEMMKLGCRKPLFSFGISMLGRTELNISRYELMLALKGYDSLEWEGEPSNEGHLARLFCRTKGNSIEGGTSEIQLNIISKRILGLPTR